MISGSRLLHHSSAFTIDRPLIEAWMPHLLRCSAERHEVKASCGHRKKKRTKKHRRKAKTPYEKEKQEKAKTPYVWEERHKVKVSCGHRKRKRTKKLRCKAKTPYEKEKQEKANTPYVWENRFPNNQASQEPENTLLAAPRQWSSTPATTNVPATQQHHKRKKQEKESSTSTSTKAEHHPVTWKRSAAPIASDPYHRGAPVRVISYSFASSSVRFPSLDPMFKELTPFERSVAFRPPGRELWRGMG